MTRHVHRMPFGAELHEAGGATFRLWAPGAGRVALRLYREGVSHEEQARATGEGWFEVEMRDAHVGQRYQWRINDELDVPDPASRSNPEGPNAPSELVEARAFDWSDDGWAGRPWHEAVFYELHVGTYTPEGSFEAAALRLEALRDLGITAVQLMPLADFPGDFGWGYDGVLPYAPYHGYGAPDDLKRFIQAAHRLGLMVLADVVYNHFGPEGNYLHAYAPQFFSTTHQTAWGAGINFDGDASATVREFFIHNALYWLEEFRFDGLRFDAAHAMRDDRQPDILQEMSMRVRDAFPGRHVHLVLENDSNDGRRLAMPGERGRFDGQWNGDVHHALHVLLTDEHDGYYAEYDAPVQQLGRSLAHGFARQGGPHNAEGAAPRRAAEGSVPLSAIVNFLHNHDQVGNRAFGERLHAIADPAALKLAAAIVCLAPSPPMLFMGEEYGATTPFLYFADWQGELREAVQKGRREEFAHFERYAEAAASDRLPDPCSRSSFDQCKVDVTANDATALAWLGFHRRLLATRAESLRPHLPQLRARGHEFVAPRGGLLLLRWHFDRSAGDVESAHAVFEMVANLSDRTERLDVLSDAVPHQATPNATVVFECGTTEADQLGPWSGRWRWLGAPQ